MTELTAKALAALDLIAPTIPGQFSAEVETIRAALKARGPPPRVSTSRNRSYKVRSAGQAGNRRCS